MRVINQRVSNNRRYPTKLYTLIIDGVKHTGDKRYFTALCVDGEGNCIHEDTMAYRLREYTKGRFTVEDVMFPGKLDSNKGRKKIVLSPVNQSSWVLRPQRWTTEKLKYLYLDVPLSPFMNGVRG